MTDKGQLELQLRKILIKTRRLHRRGHKTAAQAASQLYLTVSGALKELESGVTKKEDFVDTCTTAIDKAREVLEQHRGWKQVLNDIASLIVSFFSLGIANWVTGNKWLFHSKTDSEKKLIELEQCLDIDLPKVDSTQVNQNNTENQHGTQTIQTNTDVRADESQSSTTVTDGTVSLTQRKIQRQLPDSEFLKTLKLLLVDHQVTHNPATLSTTKSIKKLVVEPPQEPQVLLDSVFSLFDTYQSARRNYKKACKLLTQIKTIPSQAKEITPLVLVPQKIKFNGIQLPKHKMVQTIAGKTKFLFDGITVFIPGLFGFQYSPLNKPIETLNALNEQFTPMKASTQDLWGRLLAVNYKRWPGIFYTHHYNWDPRKPRIDNLSQEIGIATLHFNDLSVVAVQFINQVVKTDIPTDKLVITDLSKSTHFKPMAHVLAATASLLNTDYNFPLSSYRATDSFKLLRDTNFLGQQSLFGTLHNVHKGLFIFSSATTLFQASKDLTELYKYRDVLVKPGQALVDLTKDLFQSSGPWPQESYNLRLEAYDFLSKSILGQANEPSLFETKVQNLCYNLTVNSGGLSAQALIQSVSNAYIPYQFIANLFSDADEYNWYPNVSELLLGDISSGSQANQQAHAAKKVLVHFINKLAWEQLIVPLLIKLPLKGITTAASRQLADKMINNPDFILNLRFQIKELLKNTLFNPAELAEFADFEPHLDRPGTGDLEKIMKLAKKALKQVSKLQEKTQTPIAPLQKTPYAFYNLRDPFIAFMCEAPVVLTSTNNFEQSPFNTLLDKVTDRLESNLGFPGLTKGQVQTSYIEILAYPVMKLSTYLWEHFSDEPQAMLTAIKQTKTLRNLPKREEVDAMVVSIRESLEEGAYDIVSFNEIKKCKRLIKELKRCYEERFSVLSAAILEAKKQTKTLFSKSKELQKLVLADTNEEICAETRRQIAEFRTDVARVIEQFKQDAEASSFSNLLKGLTDELESLVNNKNSQNFHHLCFSLFLQFLESRTPGQSDIEELVRLATNRYQLNRQSVLIPIILEDLKQFSDKNQAINIYVETIKEIIKELMHLSALFLGNPNQATLSLAEFNSLSTLHETIDGKFKSLNKSLGGKFISSINHSTQIALDAIRTKQQIIKNIFKAIDAEFKPVNPLFEQLTNKDHLALPTKGQINKVIQLNQIAPEEQNQPMYIQEYRQKQRAEKNIIQVKKLVLLKLDQIIEVRKKELADLIAKKTATIVKIDQISSQFRTDVTTLLGYIPSEDADFTAQCNGKILLLDAEVIKTQKEYDASNELKAVLSDLNAYINKINNTQSVMSSVWIRSAQLLLVHQEMQEVIAKTAELLKPFTTFHHPACIEALRTIGLDMTEHQPVDNQIGTAISSHLRGHIFKLITTDINTFVEKTLVTMKGTEDLASIGSQQQKDLIAKFCTAENIKFFTNQEEIADFIIQKMAENMPKLNEAKATKFVDLLNHRVKELNRQLHLPVPGRFNFFSAVPISRAVYDQQVEAIKKEAAAFEPVGKREQILQSVSTLFEAAVINSPLSQVNCS